MGGLVTESDELEFRKNINIYIFLSKKKGRSFYPYLKLKDSRKYDNER